MFCFSSNTSICTIFEQDLIMSRPNFVRKYDPNSIHSLRKKNSKNFKFPIYGTFLTSILNEIFMNNRNLLMQL